MHTYTTRTILPPAYPGLLPHITSLPPHLNVAGTLPPPDTVFLCVVGSRTHSSYGSDVCRYLIRGIKDFPISIISGLAIGMDSVAHEAALDAGLHTIAFPGSGLSPGALYPTSRRKLAERILAAGGALISPFTYEQQATEWTFPVRNRLMAGISKATLIIEARKGSGTLLTAKYAEDFNRDVLAVPGDIRSDLSYGPHMLIRNGAAAITRPEDILRELGLITGDPTLDQPKIDFAELALNPDERTLCAALGRGPHTTTDLIVDTGLPISRLNITLTGLELKGLIVQRSGVYSIQNI